MRAASFKSLYPKRPALRECNYALLRQGRSRYSTETCVDQSGSSFVVGDPEVTQIVIKDRDL